MKLHYLMLLLFSVTVISCSKDKDLDDPNTSIANPDGTITVNIDSNGNGVSPCEMSSFYLISGNFTSDRDDYGSGNWTFADMGKMKGLGNVRAIPESGFASKVAATEGHGYVGRYGSGRSSKYVRIFVQEYKETEEVDICKIQYQCPFEPTELKFSADTLNFAKEGGEQTITIKTSTSDWEYEKSYSSNWFFLEKDDNKLNVTVLKNEYAIKRQGIITIYANEKKENIVIKQEAGDPILEVEKSVMNVSYANDYYSININSNTNLMVGTDVAWIEASYDLIYDYDRIYGRLEFETYYNNTENPREGIIKVSTINTDPIITKEVKVVQEEGHKLYLEIEQSVINVSYNNDKYNIINFNSNADLIFDTDVSWIRLVYNMFKELEFTVSTNYNKASREGIITISTANTYPAITKEVKIIQEGN